MGNNKFEYKVLTLNETGNSLIKRNFDDLQKHFDDGWYFVKKISQSGRYSLVAVVLKRKLNKSQ